MTDESTPSGEFSIDDAVAALRQSREDQAKGEEVAPTEEAEPEVAEVGEPDEPEAEVEADAEPEADDDGALYEVNGETFTLAELREWKKGHLRQADYTKKTQEVAEARKAFDAERVAFETAAQQRAEEIRARETQLQDALATFAIEQDPEPDPSKFPNWSDYVKAKGNWDGSQKKKQQATQTYQALKAQQHEQTLRGELTQLFQKKSDWRDPETFQGTMQELAGVAKAYGFADSEIAGIVDHRMFLILDDLRQARASAGTVKAAQSAVDKKAVQAVRKLAPGAKPDPKNQTTKAVADTRDRLRKSGSAEDAVAFMQARRRSQG